MKRKSILILLLSMVMVLSPALSVFADSETADDNTGNGQQQEAVVDSAEDRETPAVVEEPANEDPVAEEPAPEEPVQEEVVNEEAAGSDAPEAEPEGMKAAPAKAACTHYRTSLEVVLGSNVSYSEITGDDEYHKVTGDAYWVETCVDCGAEVWSEKIETLPHNYNSNHVCVDCGHSNACEHTAGRGEETRYNGTLTYEQIEGNNEFHKAKGDIYKVEYCLSCGEALDSEYKGEFKDEHIYGEDHVCKLCSYKNTCGHPSTYTTYEYDDDDVTITDCGRNHSVMGKIYEITSCEICGEDFEVREVDAEDQPIYESHYYDDSGICMGCGHARNTNWSSDGNSYYENGKKVTGWKLIDEEWYYFNSSGVKKTGWLKSGDYWYYLDPEEGDAGAFSGAMVTEWQEIKNKWYYFNPVSGRMKTGWLYLTEIDEDDGTEYSDWYYFNSDGAQQFGWQKVKSIWYYFEEADYEGNMAYGLYYVAKSKRVYMFNEDGKWLENFTQWYSEEWVDDEGNNHIDWYYFNNGKAAKGWQKFNNYWYYFNDRSIMAANAWAKDNTGWCWLEADGRMATDKWLEYKGSWYFIKPDGHMAESCWLQDENGYRWVDASGKNPRNKWFLIDDEWYKADADGYRFANCWATDSTGKYWMDANGKITRTRWIFDPADGEWYYMNADGYITVSKWVRDSKEWYLLDENGHIVKNSWAQDSHGWLYLDGNGYILKNGWAKDSVGTCWAGSDGYLLKSQWIEYEGDMYYVNASGYRVEGKTVTISGKSYTFDSNGKCLNPPKPAG
ncbi:MAG: hypothetical protein IJH28_02320 [Mogibacterium sp.]|nr:hypothetical protein [Mogibacterium sp.]MBQ6501500.1 hypothetical protein [Mogibacterium sp.]